jgi:hypothetical protein
MKQLVSFIGMCAGLVLLTQPSAPAANTNALIGVWETQVTGPGSDRTTCFLTFSNNFTWTGYGIALKSFGSVTFGGTWGVDSKDRIVGGFTEFRGDGDIGATFIAAVNGSDKLRAQAIAPGGHLKFNGDALSTLRDVSGSNWVGEVHTRGNTSFQSYTFTASTNLPGWFDVTGSGIGQSGTYTVSGALAITSGRNANGFLVSDFGSGNTTSTWSFAGRFLPSLRRGAFRGRTDTGDGIVIRVTQ